MNIFGKRGRIIDSPFGGGLFDRGPNIIEKVDMLFKDVEIEGKKSGYDRASKEYGKAYRALEEEFKQTKELIEQQKNSHNVEVDALLVKLEQLEKQKEELRRQVNSRIADVSRQYNIPMGDIKKSLTNGTLLASGLYVVDVLYLVYKHKEKKLRDAEQRGFAEAKALYEKKIEKLKCELNRLKDDGNKDIQKLVELISDIFEAIAEEQMKIAELKVLL